MDNNQNLEVVENKKLTLFDFLYVFIKKKRFISIFTLIVLLVSIFVYFIVLDLIFYSDATIKSSGKSASFLSSLEGLTEGLGGIDEIGEVGSKSSRELAAYEEIILSRRSLEEFVKKFNLMEREKYKFFEDAVKDVREEKIVIVMNKQASSLTVGVLDKDPVLAKEMVEFLVDNLNKINIELSVLNAKNNREFIEKRYQEAKNELKNAEDTLKTFQFVYGIAPDLQIKASAQSVFSLEAELKSEEVKLDVLKKILSVDQPEVKLQETKVSSLKNKIVDINTSTDLSDFLRLGNSPQIILSFLRLQRDVEIQNKILSFILPLYEQAKIEEQRETPTILLLDKPVVSERKVKPKRLTMTLLMTFVGLFVAYSIALAMEYIEQQKKSNNSDYLRFLNLLRKPNK